jgi:Rho-binding antiterminator
MTDYTPIDCDRHSEFELAIMHRDTLNLTWRDADGATHTEVITPADLLTRNSEEFMRVSDANGVEREIRLDRILQFSRI